jgi:hypothetical protein
MSQWTHVCGAIRIDAMPILDNLTTSKIKKLFGNTARFEDGQDVWDKCNVPTGSEGSVQYRIDDNSGEYSLTWGVIYFWGDLRDYDDYNEIYKWIKKSCEHLMIRSCSIKIDVEYKGKYLITDIFDGNKTEIELIDLPIQSSKGS